jgi:hypothetical protein
MALGKSEDRMSTKSVYPCALLLALLGVDLVRAQDYSAPPGPPPGSPRLPVMTGFNEMPPPTEVYPPPQPDKWMCYSCPNCCGPVGGDGPIKYELFLRSGPDLPVQGGFLKATTAVGWMVEGGGRSLFFNPDHDRAWTVELSLSHSYNNGSHPNMGTFIIEDEGTPAAHTAILVHTGALQRTQGNIGLGREWWLIGTSSSCGPNWWVGADAGYRYGTARLDMHEEINPGIMYVRLNGVVAGPYIGVHSDLSWCCGCCQYLVGLRAEWDYSFMNLLPNQNNDIQDVNFLLNLGVRY